MSKLSGIVLNPEEYLVTKLPDYFKKKDEKFDTRIFETMPVSVGVIEKAGEDLPQEFVGKIIYYRLNIADSIEIRGIGNYDLVKDVHKFIIRTDENHKTI